LVTIAALIVAAGRGARAATDLAQPKQYCEIGGAPMLSRTLSVFAAHPDVDDILVVIHPDDVPLYGKASAPFAADILPAVMGGARRQDSVRLGLEALAGKAPTKVLIHDAARPFADEALVSRVIGALDTSPGALPCLPVTDTLKRQGAGHVAGTVSREGLFRAQTPQGFDYKAILTAHRAAAQDSTLDFTDDTSVAEWFGISVAIVEGSEHNRKLTTAEDLMIADRLMMQSAAPAGTMRVGSGYDVHRLGPGDSVILCGVRIPHNRTLLGHSDADVGLHALTDALLGTIADGDIGAHFPPSDARWRGAGSDVFLRDAGERIAALGGTIVHADITLICETPKIGPHRDAMRGSIADILGLGLGQVSVKATTNEQLGFIGREEGIAAMATATVMLP
jgi:2-C-methyl-D-erythritol 4-phosphate cytidylyltransferase/2-C-methyl-D-erythritol 2,4-cyclodiphosphate synthase